MALIAAYLGWRLRTYAMRVTRQAATRPVEDAIVLAAAAAIVRSARRRA